MTPSIELVSAPAVKLHPSTAPPPPLPPQPIMDHPQPPPVQQFSRFEVELEFVQCLANPDYLNYLAQMQYFDNPAFIAYLDYLEYFRRPEYTKMLTYPSYTLKALELVKSPAFRRDIVNPFFARTLAEDGIAGLTAAMEQRRRRGESTTSPEGDTDATVAAAGAVTVPGSAPDSQATLVDPSSVSSSTVVRANGNSRA